MSASEDIAADLARRIKAGEFRRRNRDHPDNGRLPTKTKLAAQYCVGKTTLTEALHELRLKGLIYGVRGVGLFVVEKKRAPKRGGGMFSAAGQ